MQLVNQVLAAHRTRTLLLLLSCVITPPTTIGAMAASPVHRGVVQHTDVRRISRPLSPVAGPLTLKSGVTAPFAGANETGALSSDAGKSLVNWDPWQGEAPLKADRLLPESIAPANQPEIDYAAIERTYASAVPPVPPPARAASATDVVAAPTIDPNMASAYVNYAMFHHLPPFNRPGMPGYVTPVDTDNCACGMAIPSAACMGERTSRIYSNSYPNNSVKH